MSAAKTILFVLLGIVAAAFVTLWAASLRRAGKPVGRPTLYELAVGLVTDFFDALGIGSFAVTTSLYRVRRCVDDRLLPGTLNVGHTLPTITQAFISIAIVPVDMTTLVSMIAASVVGAWLGAGVVCHWPRRRIQVGMGIALLAAAAILFMKVEQLGPWAPAPSAGDAGAASVDTLRGPLLITGIVGNFVLGALMTLGIGLYAPCMILVSLLGLSPKAAFPIMMGSCAFLMPIASLRFIKAESYAPRPALGLALGGIPAVIVALLIVKSLPLDKVYWLVILAVTYTALTMLRSASAKSKVSTHIEPAKEGS